MAVESLDWFVQLAESGTFTRASEELQVSQQTLSSRLAALERELDTRLVVRSNPLALTRSGETFLAYAVEQRDARIRMLRQLGETSIGGAGVLKVGMSNVRGRLLLPNILRQFHESLPNVAVKVIEGANEELVRLAEAHEADVVIARFDGAAGDVEVHPLYEEEVVLVATPAVLGAALGVTPEEAAACAPDLELGALGACPFLLEPVDDISGRIAHAELRRAGIRPRALVEGNDMITLLRLAHDGLGAAFCPTLVLEEMPQVADGLVRVGLSPAARYRISLGTPAGIGPWSARSVFEDIAGALYGA